MPLSFPSPPTPQDKTMTQAERARRIYHSVRSLMQTAAAWQKDKNDKEYHRIRDNAAFLMRWRKSILESDTQ